MPRCDDFFNACFFCHSNVRYDGVKEVAAKAPKMTFSSGARSEIRQLNVNQAISKEGVTQQELQEIKVQLLSTLDKYPGLTKIIQQYT